MTTFTKEFSVTENGVKRTFTHTYRQMEPKMFIHYSQNPLGMDDSIREHFKIPDNKYYTVAMWPGEMAGVVTVIQNLGRTVTAKKISKSNQ